MPKPISILYSFRDRSLQMVKITLDSLQNQSNKEFEVIFVDYGSVSTHAEKVRQLVESYPFAVFVGVPAFGKLWSRSKALNIGIRKAKYDLIFIVDIDLFFASVAMEEVAKNVEEESYFGADWIFLSKNDSEKFLDSPAEFKPSEFKKSDDNGMLLIEKTSLESIQGYDEFFHLYGGEDTDLKFRLQLAGISKKKIMAENLFFHIWHPHVIQKRPNELVPHPYAYNIKRINEKHVFYNQQMQSASLPGQLKWGELEESNLSRGQVNRIDLPNIHSFISHFFNFTLAHSRNQLFEVHIKEAPEYKTLKAKVKTFFKGNSEPFMSMQEINELISEKIVFTYRDHHYAYFIDSKMQVITFKIRT